MFTESDIREAMRRHYPIIEAFCGDVVCRCSGGRIPRRLVSFDAEHLLEVLGTNQDVASALEGAR